MLHKAKASGNYLYSMLALKDALNSGFDEALILDVDNNVNEGSGENFFMVKDDILYTPRDHTVLNGITRQTIIDISEDLDLEVFEKDISVDDVKVADEALILDVDNNVNEGSGENFFMVKDDILYTPRDHTVLNGITRQTIIDISKDLDLEVYEKDISVDDVKVADEAFFTGTAAEVTPVVQVDQSKIGDGTTGKITRKVQKEYFDLIRGKNTKYDHWLTRV